MYEDLIAGIARNAIAKQEKHNGDYIEDGILICGECKEPRQKWLKTFTSDILVTRMCKCERDEEKKIEEKKLRDEANKNLERIRNLSLMDSKLERATFSSWQTNESNAECKRLCYGYANTFERQKEKGQGLLLYGDVGTGKSFAAACIANELIIKGIPIVMTSIVKLMGIFGTDSEADTLSNLKRAELLIIDDLGAERNTPYALEKVYMLIDERYRTGRPMIVTTNLSLEQMVDESDIRYSRIYDRILEVCYPIRFNGISWRRAAILEKMRGHFLDE